MKSFYGSDLPLWNTFAIVLCLVAGGLAMKASLDEIRDRLDRLESKFVEKKLEEEKCKTNASSISQKQ